MGSLIWLVLAGPLVGVAAAVVGFPLTAAGWISAAALATDFILAVLLAGRTSGGMPVTAVAQWVSVNALGSLLLVLESFAGLTALLFSLGHLPTLRVGPHRERSYLIWFNSLLFALFSVPLMDEIALVWLGLTLTTLFSVFLVSFDRSPAALEAGWKYALLTTLGAAVAVLGVLLLYWGVSRTGQSLFTWESLRAAAAAAPPAIMNLAFLLLLVGFGTKAALIPLHAWMPDTYSQAPFPVCAMLSVLESAAIPYVLLRLAACLSGAPGEHAQAWLLLFGLLSAAGASLLLLQTQEYKRLFAYSTVENAGIILAIGAIGLSATHQAAIWQMLTHALAKPLVFYAAAILFLVSGKSRIGDVRGVLTRSPSTGAVLMAAGLAAAGAPPFALFLSELAVLKSGLASTEAWVALILAGCMIVSFCSISFQLFRMILGTPPEDAGAAISPMPKSCLASLLLAGAPVVVLGWMIPPALVKWISAAALVLRGGG